MQDVVKIVTVILGEFCKVRGGLDPMVRGDSPGRMDGEKAMRLERVCAQTA